MADQGIAAMPGRAGRFVTPAYRIGFVLVVSLFFLWAIANNFNDILIRQFQKSLGLNRAEAGFIQFVFYIGYFVCALPAGLLMRAVGYRTGILVGLALYGVGALLFLPASYDLSYPLFLFALFMIASGAAFLETTAAAYVSSFGDPASAVQRLNFAQAFNGLGGFLAPILGGLLIFSGVEHSASALQQMSPAALAAYHVSEAGTVRLPYLVLALAAAVVAVMVGFARLPDAHIAPDVPLRMQFRRLARHRPLIWAATAQFFYVGAQVGIWSFFIDFVKDVEPLVRERQAAYLLSVSLILFMAGRFAGTALMARIAPARLLMVYAFVNIALCAVAVAGQGWFSLIALMMTSFFMSIMFPTTFALGVHGLGPDRPLASSCMIMAVIGGAVFPPLIGLLSVSTGHVATAMLLPLGCFVVIASYGRMVHRSTMTGPSEVEEASVGLIP